MDTFVHFVNVAAERLGARATETTDDFFAEKENLVKPGRGIFIPEKYTERGKWMDGWESRRKRTPGHDWCIVQLGARARIFGVDIDTNHFLGNHPPHASIDALDSLNTSSEWNCILEKSPLEPGSQNLYAISGEPIADQLRLNIFPDGGVARLKVYGMFVPALDSLKNLQEFDAAAALNGGVVLKCSDMFFSHKDNLIMPERGFNMGDGWETKRRRGPGHDWTIIRLGATSTLEKVIIDTAHFKGNFPDSCSLEATNCDGKGAPENWAWEPVFENFKLQADAIHEMASLKNQGPYTHVRFNIFPDGGVSRLRLIGKAVSEPAEVFFGA